MSTISVISLLLCDFVLQTCELIMDDFKKRSPGSIVVWSIIATQQPGAVDLLSIQPVKWYFQIIHSSFSSLQQTSIQVTAELIREKLSLCFSFCFSFSPPPRLKWHRRASHLILSSSSFFSTLHLSSAHAPPASIFLFLPHLSSLLRSLLKMTRVALRERKREKNGGTLPVRVHVCHQVQFPGFSPESHFWFLFNTETQRAGAEGTT